MDKAELADWIQYISGRIEVPDPRNPVATFSQDSLSKLKSRIRQFPLTEEKQKELFQSVQKAAYEMYVQNFRQRRGQIAEQTAHRLTKMATVAPIAAAASLVAQQRINPYAPAPTARMINTAASVAIQRQQQAIVADAQKGMKNLYKPKRRRGGSRRATRRSKNDPSQSDKSK